VGIRVLLVDDHKIVREGLRVLLDTKPDIEVVAEADNGRTALELARKVMPDVVVMDVTMPDLNGIEAAHRLITELSDIKVIALSMHSDHRLVSEMLAAGASGYLLKDCAFEELEKAIRAAVANDIYLSPQITRTVINHHLRNPSPTKSLVFSVLTGREQEILQLLAEGKNMKKIAFYLGVSIKTIETHRRRLMKKLNVTSIAELTKVAIREGVTSLTG
jgi:DNA-binding NarL/FixJ family response regulator